MSARDIMTIGVLTFVVGTMFFIGYFAFDTLIDQLLLAPPIAASPEATAALEGTQHTVLEKMDYIIFGLFIGLTVALIVTGWMVGGNPLFVTIYFIFVIIADLVALVLGWAWDQFANASVFGNTISHFPITNYLISHGGLVVGVVGCIGLIVMFGKPYFQGGQQ